jgi:hypothetical protein
MASSQVRCEESTRTLTAPETTPCSPLYRGIAIGWRQSGRMSRLLGLPRAHGLIRKFSKTHRQQVTPRGREQIAAILAARADGVEKLVEAA